MCWGRLSLPLTRAACRASSSRYSTLCGCNPVHVLRKTPPTAISHEKWLAHHAKGAKRSPWRPNRFVRHCETSRYAACVPCWRMLLMLTTCPTQAAAACRTCSCMSRNTSHASYWLRHKPPRHCLAPCDVRRIRCDPLFFHS